MFGEDEREYFTWAGLAACGLFCYGIATGHLLPGFAPSVRPLLTTFLGL